MDSSATQQFCYFLSFTVTLTCFVVKVPQILSIVQSKSCKGVSLSSLILEECGYSVMLTYNFAKEYPFSAYSEYPFLVLQDLILIIAVLHYSNTLTVSTLPVFVLYFMVYSGLGYRWFPDFVLNLSANLITPLGIFSKSAQIKKLYTDKNPGQVNIWTWVIVTYGATARVITTLLQTGDLAVLVNFLFAATLNFTIVCMILYYKRKMASKLY